MDIISFGAPQRDEGIQRQLRRQMYATMQEAFAMTCLPWSSSHVEDRGDGILIVLPPEVPAFLLLDPLAHHVNAVLRRRNRYLSSAAQIRLRMAGHSGFVFADPYGVLGHAVTHLFRMLDSADFKAAIEVRGDRMGVIVSDRLFGDVAGHGGYVDAERYRALRVRCKETDAVAWLWLPPPVEGQPAP